MAYLKLEADYDRLPRRIMICLLGLFLNIGKKKRTKWNGVKGYKQNMTESGDFGYTELLCIKIPYLIAISVY